MRKGNFNQASAQIDNSVFAKNLPIEFSKRKADTSNPGMRNRGMVLSNNSTDFQFLRDRKRKHDS